MAAGAVEDAELTVEELAAAAGTSVRTTRYYAGLGLLPAPERRGRVAYYGPSHRARLELIRALQEHGFTLAAIERHLATLPPDASAEELAVQRALLTAWGPAPWERLGRHAVEGRAGRRLDDADVAWLVAAGALRRTTEPDFEVHPLLERAVALRDAGLPSEALSEAGAAVRRHMAELADELTQVLRTRVLAAYRRGDRTTEEARRLAETLDHLRALSLDALVSSFQDAAHDVAVRNL